MAFKRLVKFAVIIIGLFVLGLTYLSYKGWMTANWNTVEEQTRGMAFNASQQVMNMVEHTASQFQVHPTLINSEALPICATTGFLGGFFLGLKH